MKAGPRAAASSLVLLIGSNLYGVQILAGTGKPGQGAGIRLTKPDGTRYDVDTADLWPRCDCPDFIFRRDGLDPLGCKHIRALARSGLLGRAAGGQTAESFS